jgi:hypothetical protein
LITGERTVIGTRHPSKGQERKKSAERKKEIRRQDPREKTADAVGSLDFTWNLKNRGVLPASFGVDSAPQGQELGVGLGLDERRQVLIGRSETRRRRGEDDEEGSSGERRKGPEPPFELRSFDGAGNCPPPALHHLLALDHNTSRDGSTSSLSTLPSFSLCWLTCQVYIVSSFPEDLFSCKKFLQNNPVARFVVI